MFIYKLYGFEYGRVSCCGTGLNINYENVELFFY